jgi:hypothetical protein
MKNANIKEGTLTETNKSVNRAAHRTLSDLQHLLKNSEETEQRCTHEHENPYRNILPVVIVEVSKFEHIGRI